MIQTVIISGGTSGIGLAAAEILARFLSSPVRIALYTAASASRSNIGEKEKRPHSGLFSFDCHKSTCRLDR